MKNTKLLIGAGIVALAIYLFKKDSSGMNVYGKLFPKKEKKCLKWNQVQCITAPCPQQCEQYEK